MATFILFNAGNRDKARGAVQGSINGGELEQPASIEDIDGLMREPLTKHQPIQDRFSPKTGRYLQRL